MWGNFFQIIWGFFYEPDQWANGVDQAIKTWGLAAGLPLLLIQFLVMIPVAAALIGLVFLNVMFVTWLERKIAGRIQVRYGPTRTGPAGLLQPVADAIKAMSKQALALPSLDRMIFFICPMMILTMALLTFVVIPFAPGWVVSDMENGLLYIFVVSGIGSVFAMIAGWGSNNKWSLMGGMRVVSQMVAYEVPLMISVMAVALLAGSLNMVEIVKSQAGVWNIVRQPLAFLLFFIVSIAEINRAPFDLEEAEQELVGGYMTEFSGMRFALMFLGEYVHLLGVSMIITTLFLGGWQGPFLPPIIWFIIKTYFVIFLYMWVRWTYPRIRVDHLMQFNWKFILPLALINLAVTSVILVL